MLDVNGAALRKCVLGRGDRGGHCRRGGGGGAVDADGQERRCLEAVDRTSLVVGAGTADGAVSSREQLIRHALTVVLHQMAGQSDRSLVPPTASRVRTLRTQRQIRTGGFGLSHGVNE